MINKSPKLSVTRHLLNVKPSHATGLDLKTYTPEICKICEAKNPVTNELVICSDVSFNGPPSTVSIKDKSQATNSENEIACIISLSKVDPKDAVPLSNSKQTVASVVDGIRDAHDIKIPIASKYPDVTGTVERRPPYLENKHSVTAIGDQCAVPTNSSNEDDCQHADVKEGGTKHTNPLKNAENDTHSAYNHISGTAPILAGPSSFNCQEKSKNEPNSCTDERTKCTEGESSDDHNVCANEELRPKQTCSPELQTVINTVDNSSIILDAKSGNHNLDTNTPISEPNNTLSTHSIAFASEPEGTDVGSSEPINIQHGPNDKDEPESAHIEATNKKIGKKHAPDNIECKLPVPPELDDNPALPEQSQGVKTEEPKSEETKNKTTKNVQEQNTTLDYIKTDAYIKAVNVIDVLGKNTPNHDADALHVADEEHLVKDDPVLGCPKAEELNVVQVTSVTAKKVPEEDPVKHIVEGKQAKTQTIGTVDVPLPSCIAVHDGRHGDPEQELAYKNGESSNTIAIKLIGTGENDQSVHPCVTGAKDHTEKNTLVSQKTKILHDIHTEALENKGGEHCCTGAKPIPTDAPQHRRTSQRRKHPP